MVPSIVQLISNSFFHVELVIFQLAHKCSGEPMILVSFYFASPRISATSVYIII